jgi:hypothetical protein
MTDRLAEIEQRTTEVWHGSHHRRISENDFEWLIEEVKRLREQHEYDMATIERGSQANAGLEIENKRLRAALGEIVVGDVTDMPAWHMGAIARRTLGDQRTSPSTHT